jgi:hypothetical protein
MNTTDVRDYVLRYLQAHQSHIIERSPGHVQVKLPPEVDKDLTNRTYYWSFVEKTGVEPETITMTMIFDPDRIPDGTKGEEVRYGSQRLNQIFQSVHKRGRFVRMFQERSAPTASLRDSTPYFPWLGINYKIEYMCDKKRDVLISVGVNLCTGEQSEGFYGAIKQIALTPRLPNNTHIIRPVMELNEAIHMVEKTIENKLATENYNWADEAKERLQEEIEIIEAYYTGRESNEENENESEEENKPRDWKIEREQRIQETQWQFNPRIRISTINAGIFYLASSFEPNPTSFDKTSKN